MFDRAKFWRYTRYTVLTVALLAAFFTLYLDFRVRSEFEGRRFALPARIYARPLELHAGLRIAQIDVVRELQEAGYSQGPREGDPGWFANDNDWLEVAIRPFVFWDGLQPAKRVRVAFDSGVVKAVQDAEGRELPLARLEPLAIGGIYPANNEDRVLVRLSEVPKPMVQALIANEDRNFYSHHGFDLRGIARAAFSFLRLKGLQGGSTLTQQLVKNFFLTPERTLSRKVTELFMAVQLEMHYDKDEILETYLNEIYLGQDRDRAIHGVGLAALFYFGKTVEHLTLAESALLVGMVKGPTFYDPFRNPERALERRNLVLRETKDRGFATMEEYSKARASDLGVNQKAAMGTSPHPAFLDLVHRQLRRDYDEADLRSEGLRVFTTLAPRVQAAAERALERRIAQFDRGKIFGEPGLEGAVVVTDTQSGEVQALVGGRDVRFRGFNRALDAARPVGSLLKPAIYLTALADPAHYTLVTPIDDGPFVWKSRGAPDTKHPFFSDKAVRRALAMASDRGTVATRFYGDGLTGKPTCNILTAPEPMNSKASASFDVCKFDVAAANKELDSAGWVKGSDGVRAKGPIKLEITYSTTVNAVRQNVQNVMKQNWEQVGFKVTLKSVDAGVFFTNTSPDGANHFWTDVEMFTNSGDPDPTSYFNGWTCAQVTAKANNWNFGNYHRYCNKDFDAIVASLRTETDQNKRNDLATKANDLLLTDVVVIPLVNRTFAASGVSKSLKGVDPTPWDSEMWNIADWTK